MFQGKWTLKNSHRHFTKHVDYRKRRVNMCREIYKRHHRSNGSNQIYNREIEFSCQESGRGDKTKAEFVYESNDKCLV